MAIDLLQLDGLDLGDRHRLYRFGVHLDRRLFGGNLLVHLAAVEHRALTRLSSVKLFATFFFDYEFLILYTTINFWATIVIVNVLAIGPHCERSPTLNPSLSAASLMLLLDIKVLYKAFTESFMPYVSVSSAGSYSVPSDDVLPVSTRTSSEKRGSQET